MGELYVYLILKKGGILRSIRVSVENLFVPLGGF